MSGAGRNFYQPTRPNEVLVGSTLYPCRDPSPCTLRYDLLSGLDRSYSSFYLNVDLLVVIVVDDAERPSPTRY